MRLLFTVLLAIVTAKCTALTQRDVNVMKGALRNAIAGWRENNRLPLLAGTVRLMFHDCVGGCNGCIQYNNADNNGLARYEDRLENVYQDYAHLVSRADFWALASITALDMGTEDAARGRGRNAANHNVVFRYGRKDCQGVQNEFAQFPNSERNLDHVLDYFRSHFGFNSRETVALMGAHTLGGVHRVNSGFPDNQWVNNPNQLDNAFYADLASNGKAWFQRANGKGGGGKGQRAKQGNGGPPPNNGKRGRRQAGKGGKGKGGKGPGGNGPAGKGQGGNGPAGKGPGGKGNGVPPPDRLYWWEAGNGRGFMLNTDMSMYKSIQVDGSGQTQCNYNTCPASSTASIVEEYARNNNAWIRDFSAVFQKLIEFGAPNLVEPSF